MPLPFHRRRLDPDAADFCQRSGATDRAAINAFVRGVKALGLWDKMVCWPLRSSQNAGSGNTVYSLGGLGTFDGTLVNFSSGAWTADGIVFDGSNDRIITDLQAEDHATGLSQLVVFNAATDTQAFSMFFGDEGDGGVGRHGTMMRRNGSNNEIGFSTNLTGGLVLVTQAVTFGQWNAVHNRLVAPSIFLSVNSASETAGTGTGTFSISPITEDRVGFGARQKATTPAFHAKMTAAFGAFWSSGTSASQMQAVKALYRNTLGTGLGLPDYDPSTIEYANRSGATDLANIDAFVRGVKDLGLWDKMVCWPLRSSQNAGTGDTVYSLGGLGTFNGTRVNGPAWTADGIDYDGVDDVITTSFTLGATQVFCGVVGDMPTSGPPHKGNFYAQGNPPPTQSPIYFLNPRSGFGGEYRYSNSQLAIADNTTSGVHMWSCIGGVGLNTKGYRSTTLLGTAGGAVATEPSPNVTGGGLWLGRSSGAYQGTAAFAFIIHAAPSSPDAFYSLYKSTLGTGLGLP